MDKFSVEFYPLVELFNMLNGYVYRDLVFSLKLKR